MTSATPENTAQTWHDLTDQLTLAQVARLREQEQNPTTFSWQRPQTADKLRSSLLDDARRYGRGNLSNAMYAHVPSPAGAVDLWSDWSDPGDGVDCRYFDGVTRRVDGPRSECITVHIVGTQYPDGHADRDEIKLGNIGSDDCLTRAQARQLAQAILDACDEADEMNKCDPIAVDS
jgi:hypothetical protein